MRSPPVRGLSSITIIMWCKQRKILFLIQWFEQNTICIYNVGYVVYRVGQPVLWLIYYWCCSSSVLYYLSHHHVEFQINSNLGRQELLITYCPIKIIRIFNIFIKVPPNPHQISNGSEAATTSRWIQDFIISQFLHFYEQLAVRHTPGSAHHHWN